MTDDQVATTDIEPTEEPEASVEDADAARSDDVDVATLRSRYAGQTAKVNELTAKVRTYEQELAKLRQALEEAQKGIASKDEAAKALIEAKERELDALRRETRAARIEAKFPEAYAELGEEALGLSDEKLAAIEARLRGAAAEPPAPRLNNPARTGPAAKQPAEETVEDILARLRAMPLPWEWGGRS